MSNSSQVARFVARRSVRVVITVAVIAVLNFMLMQLAPGDAVDVLAGQAGVADRDYLEEMRAKYGLDQPIPVQLVRYVSSLMTFDLGYSFRYQAPVLNLILERLPATLLLLVASLGIAVAVGVGSGAAAARYYRRLPDRVLSFLALLFYATPLFWFGLMLAMLFSVKLGWLPSSGLYTLGREQSGLALVGDVAIHLIMPALTLGVFYMAVYMRLVRTSMLDLYSMDFVRTAVAKGLSPRRIANRHVLRNAILPVVTIFGQQFGTALGGAVVVEMVFAWPGLGTLAFDALFHRDLNLLLGILFLSSIFVAIVNILVDLAYTRVDPRIRLE
ncbi:MAG: ABC transporter permease [Burkholderiaceae bacterium]